MDETQDHRATVQRHFFDDKDIETDAAAGGLIYKAVFYAASGRKTGNTKDTMLMIFFLDVYCL